MFPFTPLNFFCSYTGFLWSSYIIALRPCTTFNLNAFFLYYVTYRSHLLSYTLLSINYVPAHELNAVFVIRILEYNGIFCLSPVYPYLKLFGRKYGFEFAPSEMRWGIREE